MEGLDRRNPPRRVTGMSEQALPDRPPGGGSLRIDAWLDLTLIGLMLVGSVFPSRYLHPDIPWVWPLLSIIGGATCILFAILERRRSTGANLGARITLAAAAGALVCQTLLYRDPASGGEPGDPRLAVMTAVLAVFCLGTLQKLAREDKAANRSSKPE